MKHNPRKQSRFNLPVATLMIGLILSLQLPMAAQAALIPTSTVLHSQQQVMDLMANSDVLCVPSIWIENSPGVVIQALGIGLPVLGSDRGGITSLVRHAYDSGIRFFETAEGYRGMPEMLGIALKGLPRESYRLMTKYSTPGSGIVCTPNLLCSRTQSRIATASSSLASRA